MKASEAKKIYLEKRRPFSELLKSIESAAKSGYPSTIGTYLNPDEMGQLIGLGYGVKKIDYPNGGPENDYLISWE
jgi:hypothetical protein